MTEDRSEARRTRIEPRGARRRRGPAPLLALLALGAADASAAEFRLSGGQAIDGAVTQASANHVALRAGDGVHLISRDAIEQVVVDGEDGPVAGRFLGWSEGLYRIEAEAGEVVLADVDEPWPPADAAAAPVAPLAGSPAPKKIEEAAPAAAAAAPAEEDATPAAPAVEEAAPLVEEAAPAAAAAAPAGEDATPAAAAPVEEAASAAAAAAPAPVVEEAAPAAEAATPPEAAADTDVAGAAAAPLATAPAAPAEATEQAAVEAAAPSGAGAAPAEQAAAPEIVAAADAAAAEAPPGAEIFQSPEIVDPGVDALRVRSEAPGGLPIVDGAADPAQKQDAQLAELAREVATLDDDLQAPRVASDEEVSQLSKEGAAAMVGAVAPPALREPFAALERSGDAEAPLAPPDRAESIAAPAAPLADAAPGDDAKRPDPAAPETAAADPAAKDGSEVEAEAAEIAPPAAGDSARRDVAAQLGQPGAAADADAEMRGMLTNLIFGDAPAGDPAAAEADPAAAEAALREAQAPEAPAAEAQAGVAAAAAAAVVAEGAAETEAETTARAQAPIETGGVGVRAERADAQAALPSVAADAPVGPLPDPIERSFALDYRLAVTGAAESYAPAVSCARIVELNAAPGAFVAGRADPAALIIAAPAEISAGLTAALAKAWYDAENVAVETAPGASNAVAATVAQAGGLAGDRLIRVRRVAAVRVPDGAAAAAAVAAGQADIALLSAPLGDGAEEILIGFDALALVAHPDNPTKQLTPRDLAGLLGGKISDWSMIEPTLIGAPALYLPPETSASLMQLQGFAGVRRVRPAAAYYIADPVERALLARQDPNGLGFVALSAIGDAAPTPIGRAEAAVAPSLDTLRSGAYPLPSPIYLRLAAEPAHPFAAPFADYLASPAGQRAVFQAGLTPVAACDPSTCRLSAPGLDEARARMTRLEAAAGLPIEREAPEGATVASFVFPGGEAATPAPVVEAVAEFIRLYGARPDWGGREAVVVARGAEGDDERARWASIHAESVALALRCAGVPARRLALEDAAADGPQHQVDVVLQ